MITIGEINFKELSKLNDSESCVLMAVTFPKEFNEKELEEFLRNSKFLPEGKHVIGIKTIKTNVLGDEGRTDQLIEFDHSEIELNPMGRLMITDSKGCNWCKWTSDFIINYRMDYIDD